MRSTGNSSREVRAKSVEPIMEEDEEPQDSARSSRVRPRTVERIRRPRDLDKRDDMMTHRFRVHGNVGQSFEKRSIVRPQNKKAYFATLEQTKGSLNVIDHKNRVLRTQILTLLVVIVDKEDQRKFRECIEGFRESVLTGMTTVSQNVLEVV